MGPAARVLLAAVLALLLVILVCGELVRRQGRVRAPVLWHYAAPMSALLWPYSVWAARRSVGGAPPFPRMADHFPRHRVLRDNWAAVRDEALAIYRGGAAAKIKGDLFFKRIADDGWKRFYIKWYGPAGADARRLCPRTCALLDQLPEVKLAMFSILEPGSSITPHTGLFKAALRYHLGLQSPPEAWIRVDGERYSWRDGEDVLFDDTYVHEVANESPDTPRIVLFCDVERAMTSPRATRVNRWMCDRLGPLTTRGNDRTEKRSKKTAEAGRSPAGDCD